MPVIPVGLFLFRSKVAMVREKTIRKVQFGAVYAVALSCALILSASAQDSSNGTVSKSATPKKTTSSSAHKKQSSTHSSAPSSSSSKKISSKSSGKRSRRKKVRGQQKIDSERAEAIQEALIREHYLKGEPTGTWNQASEDAMRKYQADHGWQSKVTPDSRALISLGLGPSKDHLLNPESAMTTVPDAPKSDAPAATSHSAAASANSPLPDSSAPVPASNQPANDPPNPQ